MLVATVLTVYGIETEKEVGNAIREDIVVATVLTVYGIETRTRAMNEDQICPLDVATVLTVYGIETSLKILWQP